MKKIVVLGGGYAGVLVAKKLEKKMKKSKIKATITLIDKNPYFTMLTELHEVAAYRVKEDSIRMDLKQIMAGRNVNVVLDKITKVDYDNNVLHGERNDYDYDHLVVATGSKPTFFGVDGAEENAFTLWSYEDAVKIRYHLAEMFRLAASEVNPEKRKAMLSFYVIGCGFTGIEMIGELAEMVPVFCREYHIDPSEITLRTLDLFSRIMPVLPEKATDRAMKRLKKMGVEVMLDTTVTKVTPESITFARQGEYAKPVDGGEITAPTNTVIWAAGIQGSDIVLNAPELGHAERTRNSRIQVDPQCRSLTHKNVYVAGDNMFYIPEGGKPVPQMVENAEYCAPVIAKNIISELNGQEATEVYNPTFHGCMVCVGGGWGTAYVGIENKFMMVLPSFFAMFAKHFINCVFFVQVFGWHKVFQYIKTEIFTIRDRRSFVGGHFSNRGPSFLAFPIRFWLGGYFFYMAYSKWYTGYLNVPRLANRFHELANTFQPRFFGFNLWDHFKFDLTVTHGGYMTMWFRTSIVGSFLENFVLNSGSNQTAWQYVVVIFLALIGLALMGGLFTTLASFGVLLWTVLMILTVGLPNIYWWIPCAAFASMFLGSRVLSLDYWVMPWLIKKWKNIPFIKKWYLY